MASTPHPPSPPAPAAPAPAPAQVPPDLDESVAGEEDPGASLDLGIAAPPPVPERGPGA